METTKATLNIETGEVIISEMTAEEIKSFEAANVISLQEQEKLLESEILKQSAFDKLAALGLTPEEIAAITGA